jgi:hypothetical protein
MSSLSIKQKFDLLESGRAFQAGGRTFKMNGKGEVMSNLNCLATVGEWGSMELVENE